MIVSPPKAGKTTLLKEVALSVQKSEPHMHLLILLIDERPEEVTDIKEAISGPNVEVIHSTFDELPEHHKRVSEMVISRAKRLVEHGKDVMILLDSITRLSRAYNLIVPPSGRTLSGGLDPAALYSPKRFFGAARNMREGEALQSSQLRLWTRAARWMMLCTRSLREPEIWNLSLTVGFRSGEYSRLSTSQNQGQDGKTCFLRERNRRRSTSCAEA